MFRDSTCRKIRWTSADGHGQLPTPEPHAWSLEELDKINGERWNVIGNMGVYVDDLLLVGPDNILDEALQAFKEKFTLARPEWLTKEHVVTFCGYEISKTDDGYDLGQGKYIRDLLDKHNIS